MDVLKKKWLKVLFMMSFALTLVLPARAVKAADYGVWVNGEQFSDTKTSITCGVGTAAYDNATKTLTLTNATIVNAAKQAIGTAYPAGSANQLIYVTGQDLTIVLNGTNVLDASTVGSDNLFGIVAAGKSALKITGTGSLTIQGVEDGIWVGNQ
ncbi:MAG: hypothetical protein K6E75_01775, partial [Lachnospiraceae bacterium]|nr:hypothetical protein [Lachnospiraceae bacterium]